MRRADEAIHLVRRDRDRLEDEFGLGIIRGRLLYLWILGTIVRRRTRSADFALTAKIADQGKEEKMSCKDTLGQISSERSQVAV